MFMVGITVGALLTLSTKDVSTKDVDGGNHGLSDTLSHLYVPLVNDSLDK